MFDAVFDVTSESFYDLRLQPERQSFCTVREPLGGHVKYSGPPRLPIKLQGQLRAIREVRSQTKMAQLCLRMACLKDSGLPPWMEVVKYIIFHLMSLFLFWSTVKINKRLFNIGKNYQPFLKLNNVDGLKINLVFPGKLFQLVLDEMMTRGNQERVGRLTQTFLKMKKLNIEELKKAYLRRDHETINTILVF
jgi:hypothetical protein